MVYEGVYFSSEIRKWFNLWNSKSYQNKENIDTTQKFADGKSAYIVENQPESLADALKVADIVFFFQI